MSVGMRETVESKISSSFSGMCSATVYDNIFSILSTREALVFRLCHKGMEHPCS